MADARKTDWEDLKVFRAVIDNGTVRNAARELGIHHSTVSRRIENLEKSLDVRLFDRRPDGYAPTTAGEDLAGVAASFMNDLHKVERQIAGRDDLLSGKVVVTMAEPIAVYAFAPKLPEFLERYPGLELVIKASYEMLDVSRREADIAIRMDNNPPQALVGKCLFPYYTAVYASPGYLAQHDLASHPERGRWVGWSSDEGRFPDWTRATDFAEAPQWGGFTNLALQAAAAQAGVGLTMLPCFMADKLPGLVRASDRKPEAARDVWILTHADLRRTARIRAVMQFAEEVLRASKDQFAGIIG